MLRLLRLAAEQELKGIFRDWRLTLITFGGPLLFGIIFGAVYCRGIVTELPMAIYDGDNTITSRQIIQAFDDSQRFQAVAWLDDPEEIPALLRQGKVRLGLVIPNHFARNLQRGTPTQVLTIYDTSNLVTGYNIKKSAQQVTMALNDQLGLKALTANGLADHRAAAAISPVIYQGESWYNPTNNYVVFIFIGVIALLTLQITFVAASLSLARDREENCHLNYRSIGRGCQMTVLLGRSLPYMLSGCICFSLLAIGANLLIKMPLKGSFLAVALLTIIALFATTMLGFAASGLCTNRLQPTRTLMLLSMPLFFASGYVWPREALPHWMTLLMQTQPLTHLAGGLRLLTTKGAPAIMAIDELTILLILALSYFLLAQYLFQRQLRQP